MALDLANAHLTFSDDFNGFSQNTNSANSINPDAVPNGTWATRFWWGNGMRTHGNGEQQFYADNTTAVVQNHPEANPFSVQDGVLTMKATPSPDWGQSEGKPYVSGLITTEGTFSQQYGYFEMRADLPTGQGIWPAFWMLNQAHTWPPELDIVEMIGSRPNMLEMTAHTGIGGHSTAGMNRGVDVGDMTTGMHSYGVKVMPDTMTWYFDGQEMFTAATPDDLKQPLYMLANVAVGGDWPGSPDGSTPWPAEMRIDSIKAWQFPGLPGYDAGTPAQAPVANAGSPVTVADLVADVVPAASGSSQQPISAGGGQGPDAIVLKVSQNAYQGDAQYVVKVDGYQIGGTFTAGADKASGQADTIELRGDFGNNPHGIEVQFLNDRYDPGVGDRNLFVDAVTFQDDATGAHAFAQNSLALWSNGAAALTFA